MSAVCCTRLSEKEDHGKRPFPYSTSIRPHQVSRGYCCTYHFKHVTQQCVAAIRTFYTASLCLLRELHELQRLRCLQTNERCSFRWPADEVATIVGDIGADTCKFGYGGEDSPKHVFSSTAGYLPGNTSIKVGLKRSNNYCFCRGPLVRGEEQQGWVLVTAVVPWLARVKDKRVIHRAMLTFRIGAGE